ncbi:acyltransferase family protein [Stakelama saccharophila]|uniref:Acyltransferase n=1 Tax=Stakelama saccharophila TaxID=3075605 RepID=A0ABZ0BAS8_9SPHN|nr:acyltransferase [Stakelama sp. W311]WNO54516.1 acyltransferase [Stakelama sp. W311]
MHKVSELDALRGLMAVWVWVSHVLFFGGLSSGIFYYIGLGGAAVKVFIILSGFAITCSLMNRPQTYRDYMRRRFWRIYPVYLVGLGLGLATFALYAQNAEALNWMHAGDVAPLRERIESFRTSPVPHIVSHLLLLHGVIPDTWLYGSSLSINGPLWSLSLEWQFYLLAPLIVTVLQTPRQRWILLGAMVAVTAVAAEKFSGGFSIVPSFLPLVLGYFAVGILTALHLDRLRSDAELRFGAAALLVLLATAAGSQEFFFATAIWSVVMVAVLTPDLAPCRWLGRMLAHPWLIFFGERSYGFYIFHMPALLFWGGWLIANGYAGNRWIFIAGLALTLPVTMLAAILSYDFFERPIQRWSRRKGAKPAVRGHAIGRDRSAVEKI